MIIPKLKIPDHKKGDTFPGMTFHMTQVISGEITAIDLTGAKICMDLRLSAKSSIVKRFTNYATNNPTYPGGGLTIVSAEEGRWKIDMQVLDLTPAVYVYDIQFTFPGEPPNIQTLIEGSWEFTQDITYD